jgi:hypothetical protein
MRTRVLAEGKEGEEGVVCCPAGCSATTQQPESNIFGLTLIFHRISGPKNVQQKNTASQTSLIPCHAATEHYKY